MAKRRELKKNVNYIAGELFSECLINSKFIPGTDKKKADELMVEIMKCKMNSSVESVIQNRVT